MERELRIGNLVYDKDKSIKTVCTIDQEKGVTLEFGSVKFHNCECSGIPITQQWLERFGFEKQELGEEYWFEIDLGDDGASMITNDTSYNNKSDKWHIGVSLSKDDDHYFNERWCEVHQLQNLFFSLTGQELKPIEL